MDIAGAPTETLAATNSFEAADGTCYILGHEVHPEVYAEYRRLVDGLYTIRGPASDGDRFIKDYRAAGGGYEGLQAVAKVVLGG